MINIRHSQERGTTKIEWLDSRHSFSFGDYYDPAHLNFGALRVINEDWIVAGGGFAPHGHRDMEIVTFLVDGALQHKDSTGGGSVIRPGEIQRMSAGRGIVHSEFNASAERPAHLLQIWIMPSRSGLEPSYEQKTIAPNSVHNCFGRIAASDPSPAEVRLAQDAAIFAAKLDKDSQASHALAKGRRAWLQLVAGEVVLDGKSLRAGDGAAVTDADAITVHAIAPSEALLFDLA